MSKGKITPELAEAIFWGAKELGINPNHLASVISFETGGSFSTNARNPYSSGTGLIQFMEYADGKEDGKYYGMTRNQFGRLSPMQQMKFAVKYFKDKRLKRGASLGQVYDAVTGTGYKRGTKAYRLNKVWDANKDGVISPGESVTSGAFKAHIKDFFGKGHQYATPAKPSNPPMGRFKVSDLLGLTQQPQASNPNPVQAQNKRNGNWLVYRNRGKNTIRNKPLSDKLINALSFIGDMGLEMRVISGGQTGKRRTGSHRHDHGNAGDVDFYRNGRKLSFNNKADIPILQEIVRRAKANGITGIGAGKGVPKGHKGHYMGDGRMHIGFGTPATWGAGGKGINTPNWLRQAYDSKMEPAKQAPTTPKPQPMGRFKVSDLMAKEPTGTPQVNKPAPMGRFKVNDLLGLNQPSKTEQQPLQIKAEQAPKALYHRIIDELPTLQKQGLNPYQALYTMAQRQDDVGDSIRKAYKAGMNSEQLTSYFGVNKIWQPKTSNQPSTNLSQLDGNKESLIMSS